MKTKTKENIIKYSYSYKKLNIKDSINKTAALAVTEHNGINNQNNLHWHVIKRLRTYKLSNSERKNNGYLKGIYGVQRSKKKKRKFYLWS